MPSQRTPRYLVVVQSDRSDVYEHLRALATPGVAHTTPLQTGHTIYEVTLSAVPSRPWRAAFLRPPVRLTSARYTPEIGRVGLHRATVHFRTTPHRLRFWLRRVDRWVEYANSVVEE
jgi:hypothetical protein